MFTGFDHPSISEGTVAFTGLYGRSGGVFTGTGGPLTTIVKPGDAGPAGTFGGAGSPSISRGNIAFASRFANPQQTHGIFIRSGGSISTIVLTGDSAPIGTFSALSDPTVSGDSVVFGATYGPSFSEGVFMGNCGALTSIAKTGDPAPTGTFGGAYSPSTSNGNTVFIGSTHDNYGIYKSVGNAITKVILSGEPAINDLFLNFSPPAISRTNRVAFIANTGHVVEEAQGVFTVDSSGALSAVALTGDPAPIGIFYDFDTLSMHDDTVAFSASYGDFLGNGHSAIFVQSGMSLTPVITTGDTLFGSTVLSLSRGLGQRASGLDSEGTGKVAFLYELEDGRRGIAIATPVPEPGAVWIAIFFAAAPRSCRIRRLRL